MRDLLLPLLKKEQKKQGYLSEDALKRISDKLNIPIADVYGAASFYSMIYTRPQGRYVFRVCSSPSCHVNGSLNLISFLEKELKVKLNSVSKDKMFSLYEASCIGCCDEAPAMLVNGKPYTKLTEQKLRDLIADLKKDKS